MVFITEKIFSKKELKAFNGQDGQPAYVAVNGIVYDVTNFAAWEGGHHHGARAGIDVTKIFAKSPHGPALFEKLPAVGRFEK